TLLPSEFARALVMAQGQVDALYGPQSGCTPGRVTVSYDARNGKLTSLFGDVVTVETIIGEEGRASRGERLGPGGR
ncbi:MAG: hypothetical protein WCQ45_01560, partial [bacterium]